MYDQLNIDLFKSLKEDLVSKHVILFVGAGINMSAVRTKEGERKTNELDWNSMLNALFREALIFYFLKEERNWSVQQELHKIFDLLPDEFEQLQSEILACAKSRTQVEEKVKRIIRILEKDKKLYQQGQTEFTPLLKASIIKEILGKNYIPSIQHYIYSRCNRNVIRDAFKKYYDGDHENKEYYTLYQLARLILANHNIRAVVTYNYDNLLTEAIEVIKEMEALYRESEWRSIVPKDIFIPSAEESLESDNFPIYHIHGYIPPPDELRMYKSNRIILTMEEFYDSFNHVFSWQTATQLHFLCNYTCVFAGLSISDINVQRMIHHAYKENRYLKRYYLNAYPPAFNMHADEGDESYHEKGKLYERTYMHLMEMKNNFYFKYGLTPILDREGFEHLYGQLDEVIDGLKRKFK